MGRMRYIKRKEIKMREERGKEKVGKRLANPDKDI